LWEIDNLKKGSDVPNDYKDLLVDIIDYVDNVVLNNYDSN
jgi:hypothetical protein